MHSGFGLRPLQASDLAEAAHGKLSRALPFHLTV
jgi:hypothetical protein